MTLHPPRPDWWPQVARLSPPAVAGAGAWMTPALVILEAAVRRNISITLDLIGGDPRRWRPHVKTAKLQRTLRLLTEAGVVRMKAATPREVEAACDAGATDVLYAMAPTAAALDRLGAVARRHRGVRLSVLVESPGQVDAVAGSPLGVFVDLDVGMGRTGIPVDDAEGVRTVLRAASRRGVTVAGIHAYEGHLAQPDLDERRREAREVYRRLARCLDAVRDALPGQAELVTTGTPALPCMLEWREEFAGFDHQISPGTVVYHDLRSLAQLPESWGYAPAAWVLASVVSAPGPRRVTCDAGHKSLAADAGYPNAAVAGHPDWFPGIPSEEHLPLDLDDPPEGDPRGARLWLAPVHVCPTVNLHDWAVWVSEEGPARLAPVTARGHDPPLPREAEA